MYMLQWKIFEEIIFTGSSESAIFKKIVGFCLESRLLTMSKIRAQLMIRVDFGSCLLTREKVYFETIPFRTYTNPVCVTNTPVATDCFAEGNCRRQTLAADTQRCGPKMHSQVAADTSIINQAFLCQCTYNAWMMVDWWFLISSACSPR